MDFKEIEKQYCLEPVKSVVSSPEYFISIFNIQESMIPEGYEYGLMRYAEVGTNFNEADTYNMKEKVKNGWRPVHSSRHPELMSPDVVKQSEPGYIMDRGLMLVEREKLKELSDNSNNKDSIFDYIKAQEKLVEYNNSLIKKIFNI